MGSLYYDLVGILRAAGLRVEVPDVCVGWERRARSSGGFNAPPVCVFWHHTASKTSPANDLAYMINGCSDAPVGNLLIDRDGICYPIAGGACNCAGKGGPMTFSRGAVPLDSGNTYGFQIEVANAGTGDPWPECQVDSFFAASNALNAAVGNRPDDITSHALGAGDGYTSRKIDPATAAAVQGRWRPRSTNSSGTWSLADMRSEAIARAAGAPPIPDDEEDDDMNTPAIVALANGRIDHFVRGDDAQLWHDWWEDGWSEWQCLGGSLCSSPSAVATPDPAGGYRIDVSAKGTDGALYHIVWQDTVGVWSQWERVADWP